MTIGVKRDDIADDQYGVYAPLMQNMGFETARFPDELVFGALADGFAVNGYDGQFFFDTDHPGYDENGLEVSVSNLQAGAGNPWFLLDTRRPLRPIIYQEREMFNFVALDKMDDENVFMRKEFLYGVDGRMNVGYGFWQQAFGSKATLDTANFNAALAAMMAIKKRSGNPDGSLPANAPRVVIGSLTPVYRAYKQFIDGQWRHAIHPAPVADVPKGAPVRVVTGSYTVTVTDGLTPENYPNIVTLFDLLNALRSRSAWVEVVGVVSDDRTPSGMASRELPLYTSAHDWPVRVDGSAYLTHLNIDSVNPAAASQELALTCVDNATLGRERWSVASSVLGALGTEALSGIPYADSQSPAQFTIPQKFPPAGLPVVSGRIALTERRWQTRNDGEGKPDICLYRAQLGGAATSKTLRLRWTPRPPAECHCEDAHVSGAPDAQCLGLTQVSEGAAMALDPDYQSRLNSLYSYRKTAARANTELASARLRSAVNDLNLLDRVVAAFAAPLAEGSYNTAAANTEWDARFSEMQTDLAGLMTSIAGIPSEVTYETYQPNRNFADNDLVQPPPAYFNGHYYEVERFATPDPVAVTAEQLNIDSWPTDGGTVEAVSSVVWDDTNDTWIGSMILLHDRGPITTSDDVTLSESGSDALRHDVNNFVRRYEAAMDYVRALAGIVPKSKAGAGESSLCWTDPGDSHYWEIVGTDYLPVFNNTYYHSVIREEDPDTGQRRIVSTQEFGFTVRVGCPERLKVDDEIIISLDEVVTRRTYQVGDVFTLPIIGNDEAYLTGGVDGNDTHTWSAASSTAGALPDLTVLNKADTAYSDAVANVTLRYGGIDFRLGDQFTLAIEGGQFRWRYLGGAWSADTDIAASVALADGLSAEFQTGIAPSFSVNDLWRWQIEQINAADHVQQPGLYDAWRWDSAAVTLTIDLGLVQSLSHLALVHELPEGATVVLDGGVAALGEWTEPATWRAGLTLQTLSQTRNARYLRLTLDSAAAGAIHWLWAGQPWLPVMSARVRPALAFDLADSVYRGEGIALTLDWNLNDGWLEVDDYSALKTLAQHVKRHNDEALIVVPDTAVDADAALVRIAEQRVELAEINDLQEPARRAYGVRLDLAAVALAA